jgi:hypothetical protein
MGYHRAGPLCFSPLCLKLLMSTQTLMKGVLRDTPIHKDFHSPLQVSVWASENSHYLRHPELPFLGLLELSRRLMCIISMAYLWE